MVADTRSSSRQSGTMVRTSCYRPFRLPLPRHPRPRTPIHSSSQPLGSSSWTDYSSHPPAPPSTCVPSTVRTPALDATHTRHPVCLTSICYHDKKPKFAALALQHLRAHALRPTSPPPRLALWTIPLLHPPTTRLKQCQISSMSTLGCRAKQDENRRRAVQGNQSRHAA